MGEKQEPRKRGEGASEESNRLRKGDQLDREGKKEMREQGVQTVIWAI